MASKVHITKARYKVVKAFDYLTADRTYEFETRSNSADVSVRRIDGSGAGTFIPLWRFHLALVDGSLVEA